jgi:hypothetical protein
MIARSQQVVVIIPTAVEEKSYGSNLLCLCDYDLDRQEKNDARKAGSNRPTLLDGIFWGLALLLSRYSSEHDCLGWPISGN